MLSEKFRKKLSKLSIWFWILALTIPAYYQLLRPGFFWMQDDLQAFRIHQMDKCIQDKQIPCRWVPDAGFQYGYPQFIYYPPSVYYLGEFFHLLGFQFIDAVKILFILGFVLASLTMFILLRSLTGNWPALVGSLLYTYAPYRAVDVYVRGALSEFWSFVFFPLIFWSSYKLVTQGKLIHVAWLAVSVALLLITHNLMSMIFLPLVLIWSLLWIYLERNWKVLPWCLFGGVLGIGLAAFFTLPVIAERPFAHIESMLGGYFDYRQHFADVNQLFVSNHWGYGSSYLGPSDDLSLSTGQIQFAAALLAVILAIFFFKKNKKFAIASFVLLFLDLAVLFLTHQKSSFIWEKIEILSYLQFPWRILANSVFLLSIMAALGVFFLGKTKSVFLGVILILSVFLLYGSFFRPQTWLNITDKEKFSGKLWEKALTVSIFDYLPIYAKLPPTQKAPETPEILEGEVVIQSYKKGSDYQIGEVKASSSAKLRLPLFDFPGMQVKANGKIIPHQNDDCRNQEFCLGLISFYLPKGDYKIEARLTNTKIRFAANLITIVSTVLVSLIFWKGQRRE